MKRKVLSLILCGTMAMTMLAGCTGTSKQSDTTSESDAKESSTAEKESGDISGELNIVHYLSEPQKIAALDELVAGFEKEYPDVKVNQESTTLENYQDVLKLKFSTGDVPDVLFGGPKTYSSFVESGNIQDLTGEDYVSRVQENTLQNVEIDGKVYGIPLDVMANVVLYNKDIFEEVGLEIPTTYSEYIECCKKLDEAGYTASAAGYQDGISVGANFYTIFYGTPYSKMSSFEDEMIAGEKVAEDYPELAKSLDEWREIMQYQNDDQRSINTDRAEQMFANGEAGMLIIGTWGIGAVANYNPDGNYGAFMFPSEDKAEDNLIPITAGDSWMMVKDSPNHDAAEAFFEYMTRPEVNAKWCKTTQEMTILNDVEMDSLPQAMQDTAAIIATGKVCNYAAGTVFSGQYFSSWGETLLEYAVTPDMTAQDFCSELNNKFAAAGK
ncbi:MAG TPA: extracellular solute-binding protein [Candidatus Pelethocola excrementipullorum]|nr:extracellular solute-binding protein [Candidatus Pelethocola excrementipullorum]